MTPLQNVSLTTPFLYLNDWNVIRWACNIAADFFLKHFLEMTENGKQKKLNIQHDFNTYTNLPKKVCAILFSYINSFNLLSLAYKFLFGELKCKQPNVFTLSAFINGISVLIFIYRTYNWK